MAMSMKQDYLEPGALYSRAGDTQECLSVIQDGRVELGTTMDNGTEVVLEKLSRGAIIGAYNFLVADTLKVNTLCVTAVHIYSIERERFTDIVQKDPVLLQRLLSIVNQMIDSPTIEKTLDFIQVK